jgi:YHS domain-containing protein
LKAKVVFLESRKEMNMEVKDPVCGKMIDKEEAAETTSFKGKTYYFCSPPCLIKFEKDPMIFTGERSLPQGTTKKGEAA